MAENGKKAHVPVCADKNDTVPKWIPDGAGLLERARYGEDGDASFGDAGRDLHMPCPGCGRYPMNDQPPTEVYGSEQQSRWEEAGCLACYAIWQCSLAAGVGVTRVLGDLVWLYSKTRGVFEVRLYNEVGATDPVPQFGFARHVAPTAGSEETLNCAKTWLESCREWHRRCRLEETPHLPTLVLDVSQPNPRLLRTRGLAAPYAALSHRWGSSQPLCTLKSNIANHTRGLAIETVPRTFQDAIRVTRHLRIRYLWIDSLCIVQDDGDDWAREAARMAAYYTGAEVVIAASASTGCTEGFLGPRPAPSVRGTLQIPRNKGSRELLPLHFRESLVGDRPSMENQLGYGEDMLSTRSWCYQERLLARRYLSFSQDQLSWECNAACHCESSDVSPDLGTVGAEDDAGSGGGGDHEYNLSLRLLRSSSQAELYEFWMLRVVRHYGNRELTRYSDRPVAVQGVADVLGQHLGDECVYGVWKGDSLWGLAWRTRRVLCVPLDVAPTWSWASVYGPVHYRFREEVAWSVELVGFNRPYSTPGASRASRLPSIELRGQLLAVRLEVPDDDTKTLVTLQEGNLDFKLKSMVVELDAPCQAIFAETLDGRTVRTANRVAASTHQRSEQEQRPKLLSDSEVPITVWLLRLFDYWGSEAEFLVLGRSSSNPGKFERIGISIMFQTDTGNSQVQSILDNTPKTELSII
ncbi:hypothetical protein DL764_001188 [Monosporascus ibericus]|uniref:Heterokaryon incompatibility domain-containing protein n=1 Tax=Monosporascus ibericus TaxID=155417 RepID=A0A4Q4TQP5_9PEZI|nr:hypothetical protein DL764_001188 [Monosporascus ibericus]